MTTPALGEETPYWLAGWAFDWWYESELLLAHRSGLKLLFEEPRSDTDDVAHWKNPRHKCNGDYVDGTVGVSRAYLKREGASESEANQSTNRLLGQAKHLFRNFPAGSPGSPRTFSKLERLLALGQKRKEARFEGYRCLGDVLGGAYECDFVSPFTKAAGNVDSKIFVLLQDWATEANLGSTVDEATRRLGYTPGEPTTMRLRELLGIHFQQGLQDVYATNLFPFLRVRQVHFADLVRAANAFVLPQIQIVQPRLVICLGLDTFNALRVACGLKRSKNLTIAAASSFTIDTVQIWSQAHPGYFGRMTRNKNKETQVEDDWNAMAEANC